MILAIFNEEDDYLDATIVACPIEDTLPPEISNVQANPPFQQLGGYVNITCIVGDNIEVNEVKVNITYPDNSTVNISMNHGNVYYYNASYNISGTYHYFIWANDTNNNAITSAIHEFVISYDISPPVILTMDRNPKGIIEPGDWINITCEGMMKYDIAATIAILETG